MVRKSGEKRWMDIAEVETYGRLQSVGGPTEQTVSAKADCCEKLQCSGSCKIGVS